MSKELVWASIIGILFGLVIAFGVWRINASLKSSSTVATPLPKVGASEFKIALDKPAEGDVVTETPITVSGITKALTWITVSGETDDYIIQAGDNGVFSQDVKLIPGVNQIKVTAFDSQANQSIEKVLVVYSSSFKPQTVPTPNPSDNSSESAIRAKVEQKVADALNKPKAYIGVVTDIADSTIQIKTNASEIRQVSIGGSDITVVNSKGTNNKIVKLTDMAIGDFIVAMGYVNSSSVLSAQRILITDPLTESKIDAFYGKVTDTSKKSITAVSLKDGKATTLTPGAKTIIQSFASGKFVVTKLANINVDDSVIYIIDSSSDIPTVRAVFIVQKSQS